MRSEERFKEDCFKNFPVIKNAPNPRRYTDYEVFCGESQVCVGTIRVIYTSYIGSLERIQRNLLSDLDKQKELLWLEVRHWPTLSKNGDYWFRAGFVYKPDWWTEGMRIRGVYLSSAVNDVEILPETVG